MRGIGYIVKGQQENDECCRLDIKCKSAVNEQNGAALQVVIPLTVRTAREGER